MSVALGISIVVGLIVGSFFNAFVWRFGKGMSVRRGRSQCVYCGHALGASDLIPVVSFILLRGACRYCRKRISWRYPIVELATAAVTVIPIAMFGFSAATVAVVVFAWILEAMFLIDGKYSVLPDSLTLPAVGIGIVVAILLHRSFEEILVGGILGAGFFAAQYLVSKGKWIGSGDIRLGAAMGVALGWKGVLAALVIGYVTGAIAGMLLILLHRKGWSSQIPFGTFLTAATYVVLLGGDSILQWMGFMP